MTPISDYNAFYGRYVTKKEMAVSLVIARKIEHAYMEEMNKGRIALGDINRAHRLLDVMGVSKMQEDNSEFPLSLEGRISKIYRESK